MRPGTTVSVEHCPLCGGTRAVLDSFPTRNLYSEKLAELLNLSEATLLERHANWQCSACGLVYKRRWFSPSTLKSLFQGAVSQHPRGWDTVLGRFSPDTFLATVNQWAAAIKASAIPGIRRGERELLSILDSIQHPSGFDRAEAQSAVERQEAGRLRELAPAMASSIGTPVPFKRFAGFASPALWEYLQDKAGPLDNYAELGCPLWGLLPIAASRNTRATYLTRDEANYWGEACTHAGKHCLSRLLEDPRITAAPWSAPGRYQMVGLFQYLDHLAEPGDFLKELFAKADSATIVLDGMDAPLAIQHLTGWNHACLARVATTFGKQLHTDFDAIRPSGNQLYLLAGRP